MQSPLQRTIDSARQAAREVLAATAERTDAQAQFPHESFAALRDIRLFSFLVPEELGGSGASVQDLCTVAAELAHGCMPTAVLWAMHCQQVAVIRDARFPATPDVLRELVAKQFYIASVTTDAASGSKLLQNASPLEGGDGTPVRLKRFAPIVSGGMNAGYYLVTMQDPASGAARPVLVRQGSGSIEPRGTWNSLGMRGTESIPMHFDCEVPPSHLSPVAFRDLAARTMIPVGHLGWAACWMGAARGLFRDMVKSLRAASAEGKRRLDSDLLRHRLGEIRMQIDLLETFIQAKAAEVDALVRHKDDDAFHSIRFSIGINNVKIAASKVSFEIANALMEIAGLAGGYLNGRTPPVERVFRDLRSAALMYHNDHLLAANGQLVFVEQTALGSSWVPKNEQ
jgi:alkylation response protein AidB-like acyl-CoA dehydrogenase